MLDPNFRRAVLFISDHTADDGALGVILNRPLEKQVSEVVTETPLNALEKVPVFFGGPVGRDRLIFASLEWKTGEGLKLNHNVDVEEANERLGKDPNSVRAFIGYAGWGAGQRSEEHTSELQSRLHLVCRLLLEKKKCAWLQGPLPVRYAALAPPDQPLAHRP